MHLDAGGDEEEGEVGGADAFEASGLAEGLGPEACEGVAGFGAEAGDGGGVEGGGDAALLGLGEALDEGALALDVALVLAVGEGGEEDGGVEGRGEGS